MSMRIFQLSALGDDRTRGVAAAGNPGRVVLQIIILQSLSQRMVSDGQICFLTLNFEFRHPLATTPIGKREKSGEKSAIGDCLGLDPKTKLAYVDWIMKGSKHLPANYKRHHTLKNSFQGRGGSGTILSQSCMEERQHKMGQKYYMIWVYFRRKLRGTPPPPEGDPLTPPYKVAEAATRPASSSWVTDFETNPEEAFVASRAF